jgi:molecular chaperone DnaK (HSP70)
VFEVKAEALIVPLLKLLREDAEAYLNEFVYSCVITVPACFDSCRRSSVLHAAMEAGFSGDVRIINEPTAAALSIGSKEGRYLVLDFGAGTADISVVELESNVWHVLESVGTSDIGGYDFDILLAEWLIERSGLYRIKENTKDIDIWYLFRSQAEKVKIALSTHERYELLPFIAMRENYEPILVEREDFNRLIRFHIKRIVNWVKMLWESYNPQRLLLVGGSSKIPLLKQMLEQEVASPEYFGYCMDEGVAVGAAIHSSTAKDSLLIDVLSQDVTLKYNNNYIKVFQKGTPLPASLKELLPVLDVSLKQISLLQDDVEILNMDLDNV